VVALGIGLLIWKHKGRRALAESTWSDDQELDELAELDEPEA
jgi:hypothetical protein